MQSSDAKRKRDSWGDKPCKHSNFVKEYILGSQTGDYICTTCGQAFDRNEVDQINAARKDS
jgi:hypothetical protein